MRFSVFLALAALGVFGAAMRSPAKGEAAIPNRPPAGATIRPQVTLAALEIGDRRVPPSRVLGPWKHRKFVGSLELSLSGPEIVARDPISQELKWRIKSVDGLLQNPPEN